MNSYMTGPSFSEESNSLLSNVCPETISCPIVTMAAKRKLEALMVSAHDYALTLGDLKDCRSPDYVPKQTTVWACLWGESRFKNLLKVGARILEMESAFLEYCIDVIKLIGLKCQNEAKDFHKSI
jgi:hypothetical protein